MCLHHIALNMSAYVEFLHELVCKSIQYTQSEYLTVEEYNNQLSKRAFLGPLTNEKQENFE